jgi:D-alanyl-D-alanine carboxypeptidase
MTPEKKQKLQQILNKTIDNNKVFGTSFSIKYKGEIWAGSAGNIDLNQQYFIASTTKLFVTATILNFESKGLLKLENKISEYLDNEILKGLHVYKGEDYSYAITIKNLLAHTSGLPDYFQQKDNQGQSIEKEITKGNDRTWTFEQAIQYSKTLKPLFKPNESGKAHYSDTNFQLLGKIIETISQKTLSENFEELIFKPLGFTKTYLYLNPTDNTPKSLYYKNKPIQIPKAMSSFGADGGIVSNSTEMLTFIEAFFNGKFFPISYIETLQVWNRIFFPMQSGIGIHKFKLPWIFNPFGTIPELIGHSGLSGALAYYSPEKDFYITGTVNQVAYPDTSFRLAIKLIQATLSK